MNCISKKLIVIMGLSCLFIGNSFAGNADEIRALYAELRKLQTSEPKSEDAKKESAAVRGEWTRTGGEHCTYQKFFNNAEKTGLNAMYKEIAFPLTRPSMLDLQIFTTTGNLQWTAYLQNKHGKGGPFTYDPRGAGTEDYNNPVVGTYRFPGKGATPITRYGFLEGLFQAIDNQTKEVTFGSADLKVGLEFAIKAAKNE